MTRTLTAATIIAATIWATAAFAHWQWYTGEWSVVTRFSAVFSFLITIAYWHGRGDKGDDE